MADVHTSEIRSKNMRAIRTRDTAIENRLAELLSELGFSYRVQDKSLPGRPDFVLDSYQTIIFVHGCFWHRHHCHLFKVPATRTAFWLGKISSNVERDKRYIAELSAAGWKVLVVWECALRGKTKLEEEAMTSRLEEWIFAGEGNGEIDWQGIRRIVD
ncbi:very short patch repair endonuclease [Pantoea sp. BAV 3049]|uniref:very short patch repair endonuclease n=1 Tax=Pantoea sp. BAV 3049 TaxID=2654188 RepID=UPI00131E9A06|nr:DNA mismatch endonuclease Vsr [Pantoea sp. BAV 3049]